MSNYNRAIRKTTAAIKRALSWADLLGTDGKAIQSKLVDALALVEKVEPRPKQKRGE